MRRIFLATLIMIAAIFPAHAFAMRVIDFSDFQLPGEGAIAVPVTESETLKGVAAAVDDATGGSLSMASP
jgi:hypothetical protein